MWLDADKKCNVKIENCQIQEEVGKCKTCCTGKQAFSTASKCEVANTCTANEQYIDGDNVCQGNYYFFVMIF